MIPCLGNNKLRLAAIHLLLAAATLVKAQDNHEKSVFPDLQSLQARTSDSQNGSSSTSDLRGQHFKRHWSSHARSAATYYASTELSSSQQYIYSNGIFMAAEADTSNTAGISIWRAPDQGQYGVSSLDYGYFVTIQIGTPAKTFKVQLDLAGADTWVPSESCSNCNGHPSTGPTASQSLVANSFQWISTYSPPFPISSKVGGVIGSMASDLFAFSGGLSLEHVAFGLVEQATDDFADSRMCVYLFDPEFIH